MFTIFNSESIWVGTDLERFHRVRSRLKEEKIPCKYKVRNHLGQWRNGGTARAHYGSLGNDPAYAYEYEIFVYKKDSEQARYLIG